MRRLESSRPYKEARQTLEDARRREALFRIELIQEKTHEPLSLDQQRVIFNNYGVPHLKRSDRKVVIDFATQIEQLEGHTVLSIFGHKIVLEHPLHFPGNKILRRQ